MPKSKIMKPQNIQQMPEAEDAAVIALAALYQGEKTEVTSVLNVSMAMMGFALAYMAGGVVFLGGPSHGRIGSVLAVLLPFPVWLVAAFQSLITLKAMSHSVSLLVIEHALFKKSELKVRRTIIGSAASDEIMDINVSHIVHTITTMVVYIGVGLLVIGLTAYSIYSAAIALEARDALLRAWVVGIGISTYTLLAILVAISWIVGCSKIKKNRVEITISVTGLANKAS